MGHLRFSDLEGNHSRCHQITEVDGPMIHRYRVRNVKVRTDTAFSHVWQERVNPYGGGGRVRSRYILCTECM